MNERRSFILKLTTLFSAGFLSGIKIFGQSTKNNTMDNNPIINIKPLGFQWETQDPFLFCVHHEDYYPKGNDEMGPDASLSGRNLGQDFTIKDGWRMYHGKKVPGFPEHPHRGFETITIVLKGMIDHSDSTGAAGRYGDGDVQWMTAGKGVQHAEMFPLLHKDKENTLELFQIWLNLPKANKFVEPHFKMMWRETIPQIDVKDDNNNNIHIELIAGELNDHKAPTPPPDSWANNKDHNVAIYNVTLSPSAEWTLPEATSNTNRSIYFYEGSGLTINGQTIKDYHAVNLKADIKTTIKAENTTCKILVLQSAPINEPVVQHGPFVMNTKEEIQQAFIDYQQTEFGGWPWDTSGPVHDRNKGRFAIHSDGKEEIKG